MSKLLKLLFLSGLVALVASDAPVDWNERLQTTDGEDFYRVPEELDPIHFEVEITPYFDDAPAGKENFTFDGIVKIQLKALKDGISTLTIQENVRDILEVTVESASQPLAIINVNPFNPFERSRENHFLRINLAGNQTLVNGEEYNVTIKYIGNINETPLQRGVFRGHYKDNDGKIHWYAATHLQPVNSRQAFPCFDEPGFKSTFDIIINRPAHFGETYSNMPLKQNITNGDRVKEIFHRTPRMSAYLVTVHISEAFTVIADNNDAERPYRILARPDAQGQGEYALEVGPPITKWLEDYFGIDYYEMDGNLKNDQIASAYWASGATENWGLVTYRELRLLYEEGETNAVDKMSIGTITAHELAHKWFGNLITCRWWDNVWINEGFASYFEYFAMDGVDPSMDLADQFIIMYVQSALASDASLSTRALEHAVSSPAEVTGHFSGISYSKGATLLLMLKNFVTEPTFKKALNYFLTDRSYEYAVPQDLYNAFVKACDEDNIANAAVITTFMKEWVEKPGYPVINVHVNDFGNIYIDQERFFISSTAEPTDQVYPLPLTYTTSNDLNFYNVTPRAIMFTKWFAFSRLPNPEEDWVIFNIQQQGMYRVNYDDRMWGRIANALKNNHSVIHHLNRAQIVDDVFALTRSEKLSYEVGFQVLEFLRQDNSYYSWYPAITGFNWLRNRFLHLPEVSAEFDELIRGYVDGVIEDLGYEVVPNEPLTRTLHRFYLLTFACNVGHEGCIEDALAKFNAFRSGTGSVNPNLRRHVFCQGLRAGGYDEWKFLYDRYRASNNQADEVAMLRSLGCTTNDQARQEYLRMILDDDVVKAQDRVNAFTFFMMGHRSNARVALQFFSENINEIRRSVVLQTWFNNIIGNLAGYLDEEGLDEMEAWLEQNAAVIPESSLGIANIESARRSQEWGSERAQQIVKAARGAAMTFLPANMLLLVACLVLALRQM